MFQSLSQKILLSLLSLMLLLLPSLTCAQGRDGRYFLMGDGKIHIKNTHDGKEASVNILGPDGSLDEEGFTRIDEVFGFPTKEKREHISPRLVFMLDYFSDLVAPGKVINLVSGYRSPHYNSSLREAGGNVARTSTHIDGMALDFYIEGVDGKKLWEIIRSKDCCGVGHYGGANVHLDSAKARFWEAATSKVRTAESDYNRRIYLSTNYDRYRAGDTVQLSFSSVSDFGFGIKRSALLVEESQEGSKVVTAELEPQDDPDCVMIRDRERSRFLRVALPKDLREGRYRIQMDFCKRPFEEMPLKTSSNAIEIHSPGP